MSRPLARDGAPVPPRRSLSDTALLALTGLWGALGIVVSGWVFLEALNQYRDWQALESQFASGDLGRLAGSYALEPGVGSPWVTVVLLVVLVTTIPLWRARIGGDPRRWDTSGRVVAAALTVGVVLELAVLLLADYFGQQRFGLGEFDPGRDPGAIALETAVWALVALLVHAVVAAVLLTAQLSRYRSE